MYHLYNHISMDIVHTLYIYIHINIYQIMTCDIPFLHQSLVPRAVLQVLAGPSVGQFLAELGADVIKAGARGAHGDVE